MSKGFIYILQNRSYGSYVVKIGKTLREPDLRAKEVYNNSTGVPQPFDVAYSCSVADCHTAESKIHERLFAYRINKRREFFELPPKVARAVALECCTEINLALGQSPPDATTLIRADEVRNFDQVLRSPRQLVSNNKIYEVDPRDITQSPLGTSVLTPSQVNRVKVLNLIFADVFPDDGESWPDSFSRDKNPEHEIEIWEHMAKAFMTIDQIEYFGDREKLEAFELLLERSASPPNKVLKKIKRVRLGEKEARKILNLYKLPPRPISIRRNE